jgi:hypothetical protein
MERTQQLQVEAVDLPQQLATRAVAEPLPERHDVFLTILPQVLLDIAGHGDHGYLKTRT